MVPLPQSCAQPYPPRAGARAHAGGGAEYTRAAAGHLHGRQLDTRRREARAGGGGTRALAAEHAAGLFPPPFLPRFPSLPLSCCILARRPGRLGLLERLDA